MAIKTFSLYFTSLLTLVIFHQTLALIKQGFTIDLIHRESPLSPLYTVSGNKYDRLRNSIHRTMSKLNRFKTSSSSGDVQTQVESTQGDYVMELYLGTPPVLQYGIVDSGSDLIWAQCLPCVHCYKQNIPVFNPYKSSSYKVQSCDTKACDAVGRNQASCSSKNVCTYTYSYGDRSHTVGDIATETITFNPKSKSNQVSFTNTIFGCGHDNAGTFSESGSGLVGLGGGPLSFVSQLGSSIGRKFSYCLVPFFKEGNYTSKISFGSSSVVSGPNVVSTPILKAEVNTFYFLTLNSITVKNNKIPFYKKPSTNGYESSEGNIIIDSGTTLTLLPTEMYDDLTAALDKAIDGEKVEDPTGTLSFCYQTKDSGADLNIPDVTAHFDGAEVVLKASNTFVEVSDGVVCLAIAPSDAQIGAILGNIAQMNFLIGYDLDEGKVSFKSVDCTKDQ